MKILTLCLVTCAFACGGDDDAADVCSTPADCNPGDRCVNGFCVPGERDAATDTRVDSSTDSGSEDTGVDAGDDAPNPRDMGTDATDASDSAIDTAPVCSDDLDCDADQNCVGGVCVATSGCPDIVGTWGLCDDEACTPAPVCYAGTHEITLDDATSCLFRIVPEVGLTVLVTGRMSETTRNNFDASGLTFRPPQECGSAAYVASDERIRFDCVDCGPLLQRR